MAKDNKSHQVKTSEGSLESVKTKEKEPVVEKMRVEDSKKEDKLSMPTTKKESQPNEPVKPFKTSFEKWIESSLLDPQAKEDRGSTINLGREGLKNASQVKKFLLSPAGKDVIAELGAQMALQRNINLQNQQDRMEHELFKRRLMAALFLWYLSKKSHAAEKAKEIIREYNEKAIKNAEKASKPSPQSTSSTSQADKEIQKMLDEYEQVIKRAQENIKKGEELEKKLDKLERQGKDLEDKYKTYEENLEGFEKLLTDSEELSLSEINEKMETFSKDSEKLTQLMEKHKGDEKTVQSLQREHHDIKAKLANLQVLHDAHTGKKSYVNEKGNPVSSLKDAHLAINKDQEVVEHEGQFYLLQKGQWDAIKNDLAALEKAQKDYSQSKHDLATIKMEALIHKLSLEMEKQLETINDLIMSTDPEKNEEATKLLHKHNGLNLKLANLHDMLAVHRKEKSFFNEKGEEVTSLNDAHYVIGKDQQLFNLGGKFYPIHKEQKILEKDGKFYLLKQGEDWESIKDSPEKQKKAEHDFHKLQYETPMTVKKLVHHNKGLETTIHKERVEETKQQLEDNGKEKIEIANNISKLQSTVGVALNQLNQPTLDTESPVLTPSGGSTTSSPKPTPSLASVTTFFKTKIDEMKKNENVKVTFDDLLALSIKIADPKARTYFTGELLKEVPRSGAIPFQTMQRMLQTLEQYGVDTTKPSVTSIRSKTDEVLEQRFNPTPSLSPFKTS
ncbi:TPA: Dot/Icm T4SS effector LidA [Legionella pneumophila subsp. pneumophila]|nr:Dot/Icm T4SS effector LidA [Legionella pneumophila subsp. pneumophila]HAU0829033.1 Dot/Icm T4SS effector LidA [Legionella pneumophila]